jgi:transcription elongation factor Elf1
MYDAVYLYTCPRCGSEGVVIGAVDPGSVICDRCTPERLSLVEPRVAENGEDS